MTEPMLFYRKRVSAILTGDLIAIANKDAITVYTVEEVKASYRNRKGKGVVRIRIGFVGGKYRYADKDDRFMVFSPPSVMTQDDRFNEQHD